MRAFRIRPARFHIATFAVLVAACGGSGTNPLGIARIQPSAAGIGVTATIVGDRVQIRNDHQMPIEYALFEERWLETTLASYCFGSGGCGTTILHGQTATPLVSSATGMTSGSAKLVVVWWSIPEEPPPMGGPNTPYKLVLDVR